jgi:hypothetical protein
MNREDNSLSTRQLFLYFGVMSLLVNLVNPGFLLDIPTSYMLKNLLHASATQILFFGSLPAFLSTSRSPSAWYETFGIRSVCVIPDTFASLCP